MTVKTTSLPLDPLTLSEWRDAAAFTIGVGYASHSAEAQARLNRIINEAHEKVSQLFSHQPFAIRPGTITTVADQAAYAMNADFRHMLSMVEVDSQNAETRPYIARDVSDFENAVDGTNTHPWATRDKATWYFNGMTGAEPPVQEWVRTPIPTSVFTVRIQYRPYLALLNTSGSDSYTVIPAGFSSMILNEIQMKWHAQTKNFEAAAAFRAMRDDDFEALTRNDTDTSEDPVPQGFDGHFLRELG